jgi:phosphate starvation-inducible membrane PsiE
LTTLGLSKHLTPESPKPKKFVGGFQESANTFLDSALIFAVAMLGAAVVRWAKAIVNPQADHSAYSLLGSVMMSAFSVFPALILQVVTDGQRGHTLRQLLWFLVIVLSITVEIMSVKSRLVMIGGCLILTSSYR